MPLAGGYIISRRIAVLKRVTTHPLGTIVPRGQNGDKPCDLN